MKEISFEWGRTNRNKILAKAQDCVKALPREACETTIFQALMQ